MMTRRWQCGLSCNVEECEIQEGSEAECANWRRPRGLLKGCGR